MTSLNPVLKIGFQLRESFQLHIDISKAEAFKRSVELLELVGIPDPERRMDDYPHQLSGGMRQRVMIAMGLACDPTLLIADEPTTALDVTIQAQIVELVKDLRDELGMSLIWITHDLGVVAGLAERVLVMYAGFIDEEAEVEQLYDNPTHPYTEALLGSLPRLDVSVQAQAVNLLEELQKEFGLTYLFKAHDLSMVKHISDRVAVMYLGKLMEMASKKSLYGNPLHPYTQAFLSAALVPDPRLESKRQRVVLKGDVPKASNPPSGCRFHTRCPLAESVCQEVVPEWREVEPGHFVACHMA